MSFAAPGFLLALLLVPLALAAYGYNRARAKRYAVRFTAAPGLKAAAGTVPAWRKHLQPRPPWPRSPSSCSLWPSHSAPSPFRRSAPR